MAWLSLDEFYRDEDHPGLPRTLGIVDWDDIASWDLDHAVSVIERLLTRGRAEVPCYDISLSCRTGVRVMDATRARVIVAEGIFAAQVLRACQRRGLPVSAIWLDRPRLFNFIRRLIRDLAERRKPRRCWYAGVSLWRGPNAVFVPPRSGPDSNPLRCARRSRCWLRSAPPHPRPRRPEGRPGLGRKAAGEPQLTRRPGVAPGKGSSR